MNARRYSFYRESDGHFTGRRTLTDPSSIASKTPPGCVAIEGTYDRHRHRFDSATGQVVEDQALVAARAAEVRAEAQVAAAMRELAEIDRRKVRAIGELILDAGNTTARAKLEELDAAAVAARAKLTRAQ